jgi:hypothetical protein
VKKHLSLLFISILTVALSAWAQSGSSGSTAPDSSAQTGASSGAQGSMGSQSGTTGSQSGSMGSQSGSQASAGAGGQQTLEGCIVKEQQTYYLEPLNGQEVRLHGSNVGQHVNHHVQVKGTEQSASSSANSGAMAGQASSSASANAPTDFLVTEVDMVSESCPANLRHRQGSSGAQTPDSGSTQGTQAPPK